MFLNPNYIAGLRRQPMSKAGDQPLSLATGTYWSRSTDLGRALERFATGRLRFAVNGFLSQLTERLFRP